jgi:hypothetical protein
LSTKSKLKKGLVLCDSCGDNVTNFVAVLKNDHGRTMNKHWFICMNCYYRDDFWQARIAEKVMQSQPNKPKRKGPSTKNSVSKDAWDTSTTKKSTWDTDW